MSDEPAGGCSNFINAASKHANTELFADVGVFVVRRIFFSALNMVRSDFLHSWYIFVKDGDS